MVERISGEDFRASDGVGDWTVQGDEVVALFKTGSFVKGVALIDAITPLAEAADHHPDVDLRYPSVHILLTTHEAQGLTQRDVALARQISETARSLGIST